MCCFRAAACSTESGGSLLPTVYGEDADANGDCPSRDGARLLYHKQCGDGTGNGHSLLLMVCKCNTVNEAIGHA